VLLHGNEHTGWQAVQSVLNQYRGRPLPRSLLLLVGNIDAAKAKVRTLAGQADYNRTWPGTPNTSAPEAALMRDVVEIVRQHPPFASIDIHNNTGSNPHYACVNRLDEHHLHLARLFGRTVVYFERPLGVQAAALAGLCPAVTVECGRAGGTSGVVHAAEFISALLGLSRFPEHALPDDDLDLMRTFAILKVPPGRTMSFDGSAADFRFRADLDQLNFSELEPGTSFGRVGVGALHRLDIVPGGDFAVTQSYFTYSDGEIRLARPAIPAMLSVSADAVRLDCLGYLMHRIGRDGIVIAE
jgi:hypothetical protein